MYVCIRFVIFLITCKNASVLIDGSVMRKACGDEKTAKWLEEKNDAKIVDAHFGSILQNENDRFSFRNGMLLSFPMFIT